MNLAFTRLVRAIAVSSLLLTAGLASTLAVRVPYWVAPYNFEAVPFWLVAGLVLAYLTESRRSIAFVPKSQREKLEYIRKLNEIVLSLPPGKFCPACGSLMAVSLKGAYKCLMGCQGAKYRNLPRKG